MFLSESNYASLCTFLLQLSWGLHLQFFPFADYPCAILVTAFALFSICRLSSPPNQWPHSQFFPFVDYLCSILVTAFALFSICRLSSPPNQWLHSQLFSFVDYLCSILVTAFAIFPICRLSLLYICDRIRNFSHLQIIFCATPPLRLCLGMLTGRIIPPGGLFSPSILLK